MAALAPDNDHQELICISSDEEEDGQEEMRAKGKGGKVSLSSGNQDLKKEDEDKLLDITSDEEEAVEMKTNGNCVADTDAVTIDDEKEENVESTDVVNGKDKAKDTDDARDTGKDIENKNEEKIEDVTTEKTTDPIPNEINEEMEEDDEEQVDDEEDDIFESSREKLDLFFSKIKPLLPEDEYGQVETKINKLYNKLELIDELEYGLIDTIEVQLKRFEKDTEKGAHVWSYIKKVVEFIKEYGNCKTLTPEEAKSKREKLTLNLETHLKKLEKKIKEWDTKEVDLDQEENSAYLVKARLENKFITYWDLLCNLNNCNSQTDRPIFKKISMQGVCVYPDINNEVEVLLNAKMKLFTPDYIDIKKLVRDLNASKNLNIEDDKIAKLAEDVFKAVIQKVKARRNRDTQISLPFAKLSSEEEVEPEGDPAELDDELAEKLKENSKNWVKMEDIENEFVKKQIESGQIPTEYEDDEDLNASFDETDDESESELYECEIGNSEVDGNEEKMLRINPNIRLRDEEDDQEESEEEYFDENEKEETGEPEPKRLKMSNNNEQQVEKPANVDVDGQEKMDTEN